MKCSKIMSIKVAGVSADCFSKNYLVAIKNGDAYWDILYPTAEAAPGNTYVFTLLSGALPPGCSLYPSEDYGEPAGGVVVADDDVVVGASGTYSFCIQAEQVPSGVKCSQCYTIATFDCATYNLGHATSGNVETSLVDVELQVADTGVYAGPGEGISCSTGVVFDITMPPGEFSYSSGDVRIYDINGNMVVEHHFYIAPETPTFNMGWSFGNSGTNNYRYVGKVTLVYHDVDGPDTSITCNIG